MKNKIKFLAMFLCVITLFSLFAAGCSFSSTKKIGVSMPSKNLQRWNQDGENIKIQLQAKGYEVNLQFSNDDIGEQIEQIDSMIEDGCKVLVIAAIDGPALKDVLKKAADKKIKIISYDRLILDIPDIDYYVTFNNFDVGVLQGEYIEKALDLKNGAGPFNIEIFAGSPNDNNAIFYYNGAMSVLQPYIDSGKLVVRSGEKDYDTTAILNWVSESAQQRMSKLLNAHYSGGTKLHAILSPNDSLAIGIIWALRAVGYGKDGKDFPILTGQDCDKENVTAMLNGEQSMSVFKDTRTLAARTVEMIDDIIVRKTADTNDSKTYHNGVKIVPTYICTPISTDKENYRQVLIHSGYYKESDFQ
ncbi:MAG: sugar-binding protein [Oscillospiraceae bacterium]|nr:sugar-binding protein [Oscillospiraceae bacterium]